MKLLITGAKGFIGKNLVKELVNQGYKDLMEFDIDCNPELLDDYTKICDFVFHLAGVNRPIDPNDFTKGNVSFTSHLLNLLKKNNNKAPILISSSVQASLDNPYGKSKKDGEELLFLYGKENSVNTFVYRLPNVFGKWCRPNYNSVVATFCYNIANDLPIQVNDPNVVLAFVYIDDVVTSFIKKLNKSYKSAGFEEVSKCYTIKLGDLSDLILSFKKSRENFEIPFLADDFTKKLYSTYLSYLPKDKFTYPLKMNIDNRGSFTEFLKSNDRGQVSVNISKPGIVKGNHWHNTKVEKFLVVSGNGVVRFRNIFEDDIVEYYVCGEKLEVIDIPIGYTHNIENLGNTDMVTIMWVNEVFDKNKPDTFNLEV